VVPSSIRVFLPEPTLICIYGLDKNEVTQIGAKVQEIKRPSPYKGNGIRVLDAEIKLKIGKKKS
jgi:large subunit ribosomal protein L6